MFGASEEVVRMKVEERIRSSRADKAYREWCRLECAGVRRHG